MNARRFLFFALALTLVGAIVQSSFSRSKLGEWFNSTQADKPAQCYSCPPISNFAAGETESQRSGCALGECDTQLPAED